ncbi:hypothetical protein [Desulfovibrio sp. UCD-KL4C]|uniref:hypothetical protein n=1 Tax=Desulfovibrio sp. UCD-KL4C TaxID=2578120 RepID=UPI0025C670C2|nr:hypothetical protein [Desulfovibrio sp. UCD-KL4C]
MQEISFPISSRCNLRCPSCSAEELLGKNKAQSLSLKFCEKIFSRIADQYGTNPTILLYGYSEPLFHPNILGVLDLLQKYSLKGEISSNLNIPYNIAGFLSHPALKKFHVSLSGITQEIYTRGHEGGKIQQVFKNLEKIENHPDASKVNIKFHRYNDNKSDFIQFSEYAKRSSFQISPIVAIHMVGWNYLKNFIHSKQCTLPARSKKVLPRLIYSDIWKSSTSKIHADIPCPLQESTLFMDHHGDIYTCCVTGYAPELLIGNILKDNAEDIRAKRARLSICKACKNTGFHADRVLKEALYNDPDPECPGTIQQNWEKFLAEDSWDKSNPIYLYGAGWASKLLYHLLTEKGIRVLGFIDDDVSKQGKTLHGLKIFSPTEFDIQKVPDAEIVLFMIISKEKENYLKERFYQQYGKRPITFHEYLQI